MNTMTQKRPTTARYVRIHGKPGIIPVDDAGILLQRIGKDMFECDRQGNPISVDEAVVAKAPRGNVEGDPNKTVVVATPPVNRVRLAPEAPKTQADIDREEEEKSKLIQYASDRHQTQLDPSDSLALIKARVKKLNDAAGIVEKPKATRRGRKPKAE